MRPPKKPPINDGDHRRDVIFPDGGYKYYSNTSSGWTISTNPKAALHKRWRAVHPDHGERFFKEHDEILPFTVGLMRDMFKEKFDN
jgi:hypothetical protein